MADLGLETVARDAACNAIVDLIDGGTGDAQGDLVILTSGDAVLATINLAATAFGASSAGVATLENVAENTASGDGTAAKCKFQDLANASIITGDVSVTGGAGNIKLSSITIDNE